MPSHQQKSWVSTFLCGLLAMLFSAGGVHAQQKFPAKPIRLIVPVASGDPSGLDRLARTLASKLAESFEQSVVVDYRPGSNYIIGQAFRRPA